ncbi:glycosyltransferase family 2 protein [Phocaeicola sp.]
MGKEYPTVSIVTVSYNAVSTIEQTILSVINQSYPNIEYIIIDGGSTDGTVDIIKQYSDRIAYWVSEPDKGMYDALRKGFSKVTGSLCCYINSDDFYALSAIETVVEIFQKYENVSWLKGLDVFYDERSLITCIDTPVVVNNRFLQRGLYTGKYLPWLQQESIFWRSHLNELVDWERFSQFKLAGDYYIWHCFSKKEKLYILPTYLGGFRKREGQLSCQMDAYMIEMESFSLSPTLLDKICATCLGFIHRLIRGGAIYKLLFKSRTFYYDFKKNSF